MYRATCITHFSIFLSIWHNNAPLWNTYPSTLATSNEVSISCICLLPNNDEYAYRKHRAGAQAPNWWTPKNKSILFVLPPTVNLHTWKLHKEHILSQEPFFPVIHPFVLPKASWMMSECSKRIPMTEPWEAPSVASAIKI